MYKFLYLHCITAFLFNNPEEGGLCLLFSEFSKEIFDIKLNAKEMPEVYVLNYSLIFRCYGELVAGDQNPVSVAECTISKDKRVLILLNQVVAMICPISPHVAEMYKKILKDFG
ncbi:MAG: hypothetical protein HY756_08850 [Nitrospirae bacterium]|nr:hypothetical protein [Nitrospirota bacterium]